MRSAWHALAGYTAVAVVATWPLVTGLARHVPWDLGDPVFVMWVLAWDCEQLLAILGGDFSRLAAFFDANIFHPAPLTLAYSEHFLGQALQILPVYGLTRNPVLSYNLLFFSTFVLSGLGMYLLVREFTGRSRAAFVGGLLFAFAAYRIPQGSHLQILSSQWMPLALYGFKRFFETGRRRPLAGAAVALVAQNLSCLYFAMYFTPFAAAYVIWEVVQRRLWRPKPMLSLAAAGLAAALVTLPFLLPYAAVERSLGRTRAETVRYSADVYSYATASSRQPVWGRLVQAYPKPEGDLFPGVVTLLLAGIGVLFWPRRRDDGELPPPDTRRWVAPILVGLIVVHVVAAVAGLLYRRVVLDFGWFDLRITNVDQVLLRAAVAVIALVIYSPRARARAAWFLRTRGFFVAAVLAAAWLSLGPVPRTLGFPLDLSSPYEALRNIVPGFDGLRVPARFGMIVSLMSAALGGLGAAVIDRRRFGMPALIVASVAALAESLIVPMPVSQIAPPSDAPAIYAAVAGEPAATVLAELPLGDDGIDLLAMFYSLAHRRPILNGYSGFFPPDYGLLTVALSEVPRHTQIALDALRERGATHVLVHEAAFADGLGPETSAALQSGGAVVVSRVDADVLLRLP